MLRASGRLRPRQPGDGRFHRRREFTDLSFARAPTMELPTSGDVGEEMEEEEEEEEEEAEEAEAAPEAYDADLAAADADAAYAAYAEAVDRAAAAEVAAAAAEAPGATRIPMLRPPAAAPPRDESEFDEDLRFAAHELSRLDGSLERLTSCPGVLSATIVDLHCGDVIASSLDVAAAARQAEHVSALVHRAQICCSLGATDDQTMTMLCIGSRDRELLLCPDSISGTAVVVVQDRHFRPSPPPAPSGADFAQTRQALISNSDSPSDLVGLTLDDLFIGRGV